jgi:hypothetical protein
VVERDEKNRRVWLCQRGKTFCNVMLCKKENFNSEMYLEEEEDSIWQEKREEVVEEELEYCPK